MDKKLIKDVAYNCFIAGLNNWYETDFDYLFNEFYEDAKKK